MAEQDPAQVDEQDEAGAQDEGLAGAVDDRAAELTGSGGASAASDPVVPDTSGAVAEAEQHLQANTDIDADRETLKKIQKQM
jgi:hypothetical protein